MNFELNEDQVAFSDMARAFAQNELEPHAAEWDQTSFFPVDVIRKAGELGFCSLYAPESVGGARPFALRCQILFLSSFPWAARRPPPISLFTIW